MKLNGWSKPQSGRPRTWTTGPQSALGRLGEIREVKAVTLPRLVFLAGCDDPKEAAQQIVTSA
jgi:hypothetical protein